MCCAVIMVNGGTFRAADTLNACSVCRLERFSFSSQEPVAAVFGSPVH